MQRNIFAQSPSRSPSRNKRTTFPSAIRQQTWIKYNGRKFETKCAVKWCNNQITVFNFHVAHNVPKHHGGSNDITNLYPVCSNCNLSMSSTYTIDEWNKIIRKESICKRFIRWIFKLD